MYLKKKKKKTVVNPVIIKSFQTPLQFANMISLRGADGLTNIVDTHQTAPQGSF